MNQKHLTNLELSKQLKELGVPQGSEFYWIEKKGEFKKLFHKDEIILEFETENDYGDTSYPTVLDILNNENWSDWKDDEDITICSAFLSSELGEILPLFYTTWRDTSAFYCGNDLDDNIPFTHANTESDARGLLLIYLLENGLINLK